MRGNTFGKMLSITTFGESHGEGLGVVVDGVPPNLKFSLEELQEELNRRAPGQLKGTTSRKESDKAKVLSGIFEGKTTGTPIAVFVENKNQKSQDYEKWKNEYRPGHADKTYEIKYGHRDYRGGGRSSGRETLCRVIGGYFAGLVIPSVQVYGFVSLMGPFETDTETILNTSTKRNRYHFINFPESEIEKYLLGLKESSESVGGKICVKIFNINAGLGEPAFDKLKADFAKAVMSIGACVGFSFGWGERMATEKGSVVSGNPHAFGGIEGGISNGSTITLNAIFKPTSTIGEKAKEGRHDPCILPRAVPVVEAMVKLVLADHLLRQNAYEK